MVRTESVNAPFRCGSDIIDVWACLSEGLIAVKYVDHVAIIRQKSVKNDDKKAFSSLRSWHEFCIYTLNQFGTPTTGNLANEYRKDSENP
jgi:hypothetical protein